MTTTLNQVNIPSEDMNNFTMSMQTNEGSQPLIPPETVEFKLIDAANVLQLFIEQHGRLSGKGNAELRAVWNGYVDQMKDALKTRKMKQDKKHKENTENNGESSEETAPKKGKKRKADVPRDFSPSPCNSDDEDDREHEKPDTNQTKVLKEEIDNLKKKNTSLQEKWSTAEAKLRVAKKEIDMMNERTERLATTALTSENQAERSVRRKTRSTSKQLADPVQRQMHINNQGLLQEEHEHLQARIAQVTEEMERSKKLAEESQQAADMQTMSVADIARLDAF